MWFRDNLNTGGPLGRAVLIKLGAIAELERNLTVERVRDGIRHARLEGRHIGKRLLDIDCVTVLLEPSTRKGCSEEIYPSLSYFWWPGGIHKPVIQSETSWSSRAIRTNWERVRTPAFSKSF
jgi:hypothetical protein